MVVKNGGKKWGLTKKMLVRMGFARPGKHTKSELERSTIFKFGKSTISMDHVQ